MSTNGPTGPDGTGMHEGSSAVQRPGRVRRQGAVRRGPAVGPLAPQVLPDHPRRRVPAVDRGGQGRRRRELRHHQGRDARDRRRDRLRQEHHRPPAGASARSDRRRDPLRGRGHRRPQGRVTQGAPSGDPDDLPGPVLVAEPTQDRRLDHRRPVRDPRPFHREGRAQAARPGSDGPSRAEPRALQPLSARVLRRPAPADRRRPGDRARAQAPDRRRARLRARRLDPGPGPEPAARPAAGHGPDARVHRPRSQSWCATCATASP